MYLREGLKVHLLPFFFDGSHFFISIPPQQARRVSQGYFLNMQISPMLPLYWNL